MGTIKNKEVFMSRSWDELSELIHSEEYNRIPLEMTIASGKDRWWQQIDRLRDEAAKLAIWEIGAYLDTLFDTYGELVQSVQLSWEPEGDKEGSWVEFRMRINDESFSPEDQEIGEGAQRAMEEIDSNLLPKIYERLNDLIGTQLIDAAKFIDQAFLGDLTSAEQVRGIVLEHAPEFAARLEQQSLEINTPAASGRSKGPGRI